MQYKKAAGVLNWGEGCQISLYVCAAYMLAKMHKHASKCVHALNELHHSGNSLIME